MQTVNIPSIHMALSNMVIVLEHCRIAPPPGTVAERSLPLTLFDLPWLHFPHIQQLLFYESPNPKTHFIDTLIPNLKDSLSLALKHFFPLAGNLIIHPDSIRPEIRYMVGDSVSLTIAESSNDFTYLTGNHARNAKEFYAFVPPTPRVTNLSDTLVLEVPLLALQVTLFPNFGICLGITFHHVAADASASSHFLKSWASIAKLGGDERFLAGGSLPFYDRPGPVRKDPIGPERSLWSQVREVKPLDEGQLQHPNLTDKVRATFVMTQADVQRLKILLLARRPTLSHVSTFTVTCAYVWICMVKSRAASSTGEDELEHFVCGADCRARFDPPTPETYFGNFITACFVTVKNSKLVGEEGFLAAAESIGEAISKRAQNEEGVLQVTTTFVSKLKEGKLKRLVGVAGSPKISFYGTDFGWGRPIKCEIISIDATGSISLSECRDSKGNIEIGLSFPKIQMDAFATIFARGLEII